MKKYLKEHDYLIIGIIGLFFVITFIIWSAWQEYHHPKVCIEYQEVEKMKCVGHFYHYCEQYEKVIEKQCKKYKITK